jgi:ribulose-bisphosphate carboxylase large chain
LSDPLRLHYRLRVAAGEDPERRAAHLAREQTLEAPEGIVPPEIEARALGRVERVAPRADDTFDVTIAYPVEATGRELPQLLNLLWGNVSLQQGVRIERIDWPAELLAAFRGPAFGVAGLRGLCRAEGRPLTATSIKPLGLPARDLARRAGECALGGIDLVKDDHGLADQSWAPFRERVLALHDQVERANRVGGGATVYAPNLTGPADRIGERVELLAEIGVRAAMVAPALLGFDVLRSLAETSGLALLAHPAFAGTLASGEHGFAPEVLFGDLFRLAGADAVIFPNAGGRFPWTYDDCRAIERRLGAPLGELDPAFLMLGGGIDAASLAAWVPRYGPDTIWLVSGSLYLRGDLRRAAAEMAAIVTTTPARAE